MTGLSMILVMSPVNVVEEDNGTEKEDGLIRETMKYRVLQSEVTDIADSLKAIESANYTGDNASVLMYIAGAAYQVSLLNAYSD